MIRFKVSSALLLTVVGGLAVLLAACGNDNPNTIVSPSSTSAPTTTPNVNIAVPTAIPVPSFTPTPLPGIAPTNTPEPVASPTQDTIPTAGPPVVGDLPAPPDAPRKLNFTVSMLQKVGKVLGGAYAQTDFQSLTVGSYASADQPVDVLDFYRQAMQAKGWEETHDYDNKFGIYFIKGDQVAAVNATGIPDDQTVNFLATFVPQIKGQIKGGETLVLLGEGPAATFEVLKK